MARVTYVKKAQKSKRPRSCYRCGTEIKVGDPYKWFALRIGRMSQRKNFCSNCSIRRSDQTTSSQLATLWDALDDAESAVDQAGDAEEITTAVQGAYDGVYEAAEMYRESASNIEDGFGHSTYVSDELNEKADELESFADDLQSWEPNSDFDEEDAEATAREELAAEQDNEDLDETEIADRVEEKRQEWLDEVRGEAQDALSNCPY